MNIDVILAIVRHGLTILGTVLAANGLSDSDQTETIVGAGTSIAAVVWSIVHKKKVTNQIDTALLMRAGSTREELADKVNS